MGKWDKPGTSSMDPDRSERKEKSEGDADARSERSELVEMEERSEKERSDKGDGSEKLDTSEIADKLEGGAGGSSTSGKSKWGVPFAFWCSSQTPGVGGRVWERCLSMFAEPRCQRPITGFEMTIVYYDRLISQTPPSPRQYISAIVPPAGCCGGRPTQTQRQTDTSLAAVPFYRRSFNLSDSPHLSVRTFESVMLCPTRPTQSLTRLQKTMFLKQYTFLFSSLC